MKRVIFSFFLALVWVSAAADTPDSGLVELRRLADAGETVVRTDCIVECVLVNEADNPNTMENEQVSFDYVSNSKGRRTGYFQTTDGKMGLMISFEKVAFLKAIPKYSLVRMNLKGANLEKVNGIGYAVSNVGENAVLHVEKRSKSDLVIKSKSISELDDNDVYTLVNLKDVEFVFKDGSLLDVYESAVQKAKMNSACYPSGRMDGWAGLLCDKSGNIIYYLMNSRVLWRRDGNGVPQGNGSLEGIIVPQTDMPRYGGKVLGRYQIRPMSKSSFSLESASVWKTAVEWNWNDNVPEIHTMEGDLKTVSYHRILSDVGNGFIQINTGGETVRFRDMNNPRLINDDKDKNRRGYLAYGALSVRCPSSNWWNWDSDQGKGIHIVTSTEGMKGKNVMFAFTFASGHCNPFNIYGCPANWRLEYSLDGRNYVKASSETFKLRALPWNPAEVNGTYYETSKESGAGYTAHAVSLPAYLLGRKVVYFRIVPDDKAALTLAYEGSDKGSLHPEYKVPTVVNFGTIKLIYTE